MDIGFPELHGPLGQHCLPYLGARRLTSLRRASRAMHELVNGPSHEAWTQAADDLLKPSSQPTAWQTGAEWQKAIRQEWQSQQAVRSANLRSTFRIESTSSKKFTGWLTSTLPDSCCYLLSRFKDGCLALLDPSQAAAQPLRIDVKPEAHYHAYIRPDGRLHVVELLFADLPGPAARGNDFDICWCIIDQSTGHVNHSERKHKWPVLCWKIRNIYHAASGKVLGLVDSSTLAIMSADNRKELASCKYQQPSRAEGQFWGLV
ncbi:hypothetical protein WJX74_005886 [Apatococcus lobatus]|uniref:F-box domain-containing protein n=1 Tax=Apatococcus lobatus TaxID=904363 RepID=A0AAW1RCF6_9CHLO